MRTFVTTGAIGQMGATALGNQSGWHVPARNNSNEAAEDAAFAELEASVVRLKKTMEGIVLGAIEKKLTEALAPLVAKLKADPKFVEALQNQQRQNQHRENLARYAPPSDDSEQVRLANAKTIAHAERNGFLLPKGD